MSKTVMSDVQVVNEYTAGNIHKTNIREYLNYKLNAESLFPFAGLNFEIKLSKNINWGLYAAVGPCFGEFEYSYLTQRQIIGGNDRKNFFTFEETGDGKGLAIETGAKLSFKIDEHISFFVAGGYLFHKIDNLSGPGKYQLNGGEFNGYYTIRWDDRYGIYEDTVTQPWGENREKYPSSFWNENNRDKRSRDFNLNLSGFIVQVGIGYRF